MVKRAELLLLERGEDLDKGSSYFYTAIVKGDGYEMLSICAGKRELKSIFVLDRASLGASG